LSIIEGADILHEPHGSNIMGLEPLGPHEVGATDIIYCMALVCVRIKMAFSADEILLLFIKEFEQ